MVLHAFNLRPSYHGSRRHGRDTDIQELPPMADTLQGGGGYPGPGLGFCDRRYRSACDREVYSFVFLFYLFLRFLSDNFFSESKLIILSTFHNHLNVD